MSVRLALLSAYGPVRAPILALGLVATSLAFSSVPVAASDIQTRVRFDADDLRIVETSEGPRVTLRGLMQAGGEQEPALPMAVRAFYVPEGFEVREVRAIPREEVRVAEGVRLSVREAPLEPDPDAVARPFPAGALEAGAPRHPARSAVSLGGGSFAGHRVHSVALFPVRWSPTTGDLTFTRAFDVEIDLAPASSPGDLVRLRPSPAADAAFRPALAAVISNPEDLPPLASRHGLERSGGAAGFAPRGLPSVDGSAVDMVIITTTALESEFQPLADWKTKKGVPTVIRTVSWINTNYPAGHDEAERIRLFLRDAYAKWGTFLVLVGGDYQLVTPRHAFNRFYFQGGREIPTDQYWACLEGDWNADGDGLFGEGLYQGSNDDQADLYPDVFVGRAPVSTVAEVQTFIAKSATYEKSPPAGYVEEVCHLSEVLFPADWEYGVDPPEDITTDGKNLTLLIDAEIDGSWTRLDHFQSDNTLDRATALAELSTGRHLLTLMAHGDAFKFSVGNGLNPLVYIADTDTLTNGDRLMVVMATACNPNQFDLESCGESFLNNPNGGAVVCIGPTRVDFPLSATKYHVEMAKLWFSHGVTGFGASTQANRVVFAPLSQTDATPDRWTSLSKNLLGDPELRFWTQEPETFLVSHASSVALGAASITVTVTDSGSSPVAGALVCVSDGSGTYSRAMTDAAGQAVLPLSSSDPGSADVVVSKSDFIPHEGTFTIDPIGGPHLAITDHTVDDDGTGSSSGNADGVLDAGETIELGLSAYNGGGSSADAASVTASIEAGGSATFDLTYDGVADPAMVFVGPDRTNPAAIPFTLDFASPLIDYTGTPPMSFAADSSAGDLGIFLWQDREGWHLRWASGLDSLTVTGTITTDGRIRGFADLDLEPSTDAVTVSAGEDTLSFSGDTHSADLFDGIDFAMSDSTMASITTAGDSFGSIGASATGTGTVVFDIATNARDEQIAYVDLALASTSGGPWSGEIPIVFAGPRLEAYVFTIDDDGTPPSSGNGNGIVEVGETVVLTPTVFNGGSGAAESVNGSATAPSGITFGDAADAYGSIASLTETAGTDGYAFTVDDGTGTTIDLTLTDSLGRTWMKSIEFMAPGAPTSVGFTSTPTTIVLAWDANPEADLAGYNVYSSATSGGPFTKRNFELIRAGARFADEDLSIGTNSYYQVTAVDSSGNEGPASAEILAWTTVAQVPGWPKFTGNWIFSSIGMVDADHDGQSEIYVGSHDSWFHAWGHDGDDIPGFPMLTGGEIWGTPGFGDVDRDGDEEIFVASLDSKFYAVHHDSTPVYPPDRGFFTFPGFQGARGSVTIADVDKDSDLEILCGTDVGRLFAFNHDGTGYPNSSGILFEMNPLGTTARIWGPIAVADIDADSTREIVFASWNDSLYVIEPDGVLEAGFPRAGMNDFRTGPVLGDLDNDGTMEILAGNNDRNLYAYNHDGSDYVSGGILATLPDEIRSVPALANVDADPELEIFVSCMDGRLYAFEHDGSGLINPGGLFADIDSTKLFSASPIVVDVDGDSDMEILVGHRNGNFYGFHHDGTGIIGMPIPTANEIYSTAAAGDLDADGDVDVAFASYDATVNVIDFTGASTPAAYEWPTYAGNNHRSSVYGEPGPHQTGAEVPTPPSTLSFALIQNAPNPFAGRTAIRYSLPVGGRATLKVFDVSGRLVRTLVSGPVKAGPATVVWDGRDNQGRRLASGVYFYRLEGSDKSLTRKSLLLR